MLRRSQCANNLFVCSRMPESCQFVPLLVFDKLYEAIYRFPVIHRADCTYEEHLWTLYTFSTAFARCIAFGAAVVNLPHFPNPKPLIIHHRIEKKYGFYECSKPSAAEQKVVVL